MFRPIFLESNDSDIFYLEQPSNEPSPPKLNPTIVINLTETSGKNTRELIALKPIASLGPQISTVDFDSNEPTRPYGFRWQIPIIQPSLNNLNLQPSPFNILATMTVVQNNLTQHYNTHNPQSPEPSEPSHLSTPPMNVSTINGWETPHTTTGCNTFYSEDEPRRAWCISPLEETFPSEGVPKHIFLLPSSHSP